MRLRILLPACGLALCASATAAAYPWPLKPFHKQHPIRANFGDPRTRFLNTMLTDGLQGPGTFLFLSKNQYPLWAPNLFGSAFYIFLQRQFFLGIPRELFEAARMDGDNYWTMFWRIAVPLAKPALIVTAVFEFKANWTELQKALIYLRADSDFTVPRGLKNLLDLYGPSNGGHGDYQVIIAGTVLATLPMIIVFFLGQRYFVEGIATQGRKG